MGKVCGEAANERVGTACIHLLALDEELGDFRGPASAFGGHRCEAVGVEGRLIQDFAQQEHGGLCLLEGLRQDLIGGGAVVDLTGWGLIGGDDGYQLAYHGTCTAAQMGEGVGVLFLGHDDTGAAVGVGEFDEAEFGGRPDEKFFGEAVDGGLN